MKKLTYLLTYFLCFNALTVFSQAKGVWKTLSKVVYLEKYNEEIGFDMQQPVFSPEVKALEGKTVTLRGYILALDGIKDQEHFMFSLFPYNSCFFCGGAGPETVVETFTKNDKKLAYSSRPVTIKGVLELNASDINRHMYILRDAVLIDSE